MWGLFLTQRTKMLKGLAFAGLTSRVGNETRYHPMSEVK
jgi:hypothetical protein